MSLSRACRFTYDSFIRHNEEIDGYIGLSLISKFLTTIDYGDTSFSLKRKDSREQLEDKNALALPLRLTSSGFLSGEVQIEGVQSSAEFYRRYGAQLSGHFRRPCQDQRDQTVSHQRKNPRYRLGGRNYGSAFVYSSARYLRQ